MKGREPEGIVNAGKEYDALRDLVIQLLEDFRDPMSGEKMTQKVYKREDLFQGPLMHKAPDIIVEWKDNAYHTQCSMQSKNGLKSKPVTELTEQETSKTISGEHRNNGMFILNGKGVKEGQEIYGAHIMDLLPTMLYRLGVSIPSYCDGKVLSDAFLEDYLDDREITFVEGEMYGMDFRAEESSPEDNRKVEDRLRALGYLE